MGNVSPLSRVCLHVGDAVSHTNTLIFPDRYIRLTLVYMLRKERCMRSILRNAICLPVCICVVIYKHIVVCGGIHLS